MAIFRQISVKNANISNAVAEDDCRKGQGAPGLRRQQKLIGSSAANLQ